MRHSNLLTRSKAVVHNVLNSASGQNALGRLVNYFLVTLILANVLAIALESIEALRAQYSAYFDALLLLSVAVFSAEYLLRLWSCTQLPSGRFSPPLRGRLKYMATPLALFDLAAILPFYLYGFAGIDLRLLRLFRLLWIIKLMRYLPAMETLMRVLRREQRNLMTILILMLVTLFLISSLIYYVERDVQPDAFASIPHAMWWGIVTVTTVGYGDVIPQTPAGRSLGAVMMFLGIAMFALPAGIMASAFSEEVKRKNFVVTWNLVAHMPLFSKLKAHEIAKIAELLKPRTCMPNEIVFQRDEDAKSMYFIVTGQVEAETLPQPRKLGKGEFFGELALLRHCNRTATVMTLTYTELLELEAGDFRQLMEANPELKEHIMAEADRRLARTPPLY